MCGKLPGEWFGGQHPGEEKKGKGGKGSGIVRRENSGCVSVPRKASADAMGNGSGDGPSELG